MNEALNGIPLGRAIHNGSHGHYDEANQFVPVDYIDIWILN
jgi:hypothetical protein